MKKSLHFVLLLIAVNLMDSDPEVYYYAPNNRPCTEEEAILKLELLDADQKTRILKIYTSSGKDWNLSLSEEIKVKNDRMNIKVYRDQENVDRYVRKYKALENGLFSFTEERRGILIREGTTSRLLPLQLVEVEKRYYLNGKIKSISDYRDNQLLSNQNWLFNGHRSHDNIFQSVDQAPFYIGGDEKIHEYLRSRIQASGVPVADLDGTIRLNLVIMENGKIGAINLLQGLREDMDNAVMEAMMELPGEWEPAVLNGEKVRSYVVFPVHFYLGAKGPQTHKPELPGAVLFWW